ncbi:MAG: hypothetical protein ACKVUS_14320 [Saprospiraceae bacterium]
MKKIYCLSLCFALATLAFSQQKNEFGFVVKVGTYAIPSEKTEHFNNGYEGRSTYAQKAGETYTFGLWYSRRLGNRVRLSGELLYRHASFSNKDGWYSSHFDQTALGYSGRERFQQINDHSLSLPVKLLFSFKKNGKTTLALGGGISRVFAADVSGEEKYQASADLATYFHKMYAGWKDFNTEINLTAGLFHRLDSKTSIGLEYTFEETAERYYSAFYSQIALDGCGCFGPCVGYYFLFPHNMNSFSLSLRHNILN